MSLPAMLWALYDAPAENAQAALVLVALAENAGDDGRNAWPAVATIAHKARCSTRTVQRHLGDLLAAGVIRKGDQRAVDHVPHYCRPTVYDLALHRRRDDVEAVVEPVTPGPSAPGVRLSPGDSDAAPGDTTGVHPVTRGARPGDTGVTLTVLNPTTEPSEEPLPAVERDDDPLDEFDEFWTAYDHKVGRKAARAKWTAALRKPGVTADLLIRAAESYIAWQRAEGKHPTFTKHPATWLNGECWRDERPAPVEPLSRIGQHMALADALDGLDGPRAIGAGS